MSRNSRIILAISVAIVLGIVGKAVFAFVRFGKVEREFSAIQRGESRAAVLARLGRPNYYEGKCGTIGAPYKGCSYEYVYSNPFAPWIPEYYVVSFADNSVIDTSYLSSP